MNRISQRRETAGPTSSAGDAVECCDCLSKQSAPARPQRPLWLGEIERLLEAHGVRFPLDLVEPVLVVEQRDVGITNCDIGQHLMLHLQNRLLPLSRHSFEPV
jgi:hypothetical protein